MSRILMVASEAAPFAKTGGLADVLGGLPPALAKQGEEVVVVMPKYGSVHVPDAERIWHVLPVVAGPHSYTVSIDQVVHGGARYMFVDCPPLYGRPGVYSEGGWDYPDNHIRFAVLNLAAIGIARQIFRPDVFHGHDWPAGLIGPYLKEMFAADPTFAGCKVLLTIHNLGYQGNFSGATLNDLGFDGTVFHTEGLEFWGQISFLKAGIVWADAITTVSPTYAKEIQTPDFGFGMDGLLRARASKIHGILNGADYGSWDPAIDTYIPETFSAVNRNGKLAVKRALLNEVGLPENDKRPVIGIVSRFANQKGFDLVAAVANEIAQMDVAVIALGSGEPHFEDLFRSLAKQHPDKFAAYIGYNEGLAHRIVAGSDMFLMPSRYEPCGLSQIYSLRYGTVPIVRSTGGLEDSVEESTGFKFHDFTPEALLGAVESALKEWGDKKGWNARVQAGMAKDFSWNVAAGKYKELYASLLK
ncbi:MAG: glycogen synthase GlgA [Bryobacteraceae bacterium]